MSEVKLLYIHPRSHMAATLSTVLKTNVKRSSFTELFDLETVDLILNYPCHMTSSPSNLFHQSKAQGVSRLPCDTAALAPIKTPCPAPGAPAGAGQSRRGRRCSGPPVFGLPDPQPIEFGRPGSCIALLFSHFFPNNCRVHVPEGYIIQCC